MSQLDYLWAALIMGGVTFVLRALPFIARSAIAHDRRIRLLGERLPVGMMVLLTLYAMGIHHWHGLHQALPQLIAVAVVALLQLWRRQAMLSILIGTGCYLAMVNGWFGIHLG